MQMNARVEAVDGLEVKVTSVMRPDSNKRL